MTSLPEGEPYAGVFPIAPTVSQRESPPNHPTCTANFENPPSEPPQIALLKVIIRLLVGV